MYPYKIKSDEAVAYTASAGNSTAATEGIVAVRIVCTSDAHFKIEKTAVATTANSFIEAKKPETFKINQGERVSAIQNAVGGNLHVAFLTK